MMHMNEFWPCVALSEFLFAKNNPKVVLGGKDIFLIFFQLHNGYRNIINATCRFIFSSTARPPCLLGVQDDALCESF